MTPPVEGAHRLGYGTRWGAFTDPLAAVTVNLEPRFWRFAYGGLDLYPSMASLATHLQLHTRTLEEYLAKGPIIRRGKVFFGRCPAPSLPVLQALLEASPHPHPQTPARTPGSPLLGRGHVTHPSGATR